MIIYGLVAVYLTGLVIIPFLAGCIMKESITENDLRNDEGSLFFVGFLWFVWPVLVPVGAIVLLLFLLKTFLLWQYNYGVNLMTEKE